MLTYDTEGIIKFIVNVFYKHTKGLKQKVEAVKGECH